MKTASDGTPDRTEEPVSTAGKVFLLATVGLIAAGITGLSLRAGFNKQAELPDLTVQAGPCKGAEVKVDQAGMRVSKIPAGCIVRQ